MASTIYVMEHPVKEKSDVDKVIEKAASCEEIRGIIVAIDDRFGVWGDVELV